MAVHACGSRRGRGDAADDDDDDDRRGRRTAAADDDDDEDGVDAEELQSLTIADALDAGARVAVSSSSSCADSDSLELLVREGAACFLNAYVYAHEGEHCAGYSFRMSTSDCVALVQGAADDCGASKNGRGVCADTLERLAAANGDDDDCPYKSNARCAVTNDKMPSCE